MTTSGRAKELVDIGDRLWSTRGTLNSLWQETADNFYPERADFTTKRSMGSEFADHLMTGVPVRFRRELANLLDSMLRPSSKKWMMPSPEDAELAEQPHIIEFMEDIQERMFRAWNLRQSQFSRATKEGDHDFVAFGNAVLTAEFDLSINAPLFRCWHLRDVAWAENHRSEIDHIHHKWMLSARNICAKYKDKVPQAISKCMEGREPHKEFEIRKVVVPYDEYDYKPEKKGKSDKYKFMILTVTKDECSILKEEPVEDHPYIIPRWQTVSGNQYGYSPAIAALPDARLLQRITYTLLEAGEKATNPPMVAVGEAIRSDIALYAGGITMVESEYDERLGEVLRPLSMDNSGLKFGWEMNEKYENHIKDSFYLNQIALPQLTGDMTATEVRVRTEEFIRGTMPIFRPMEMEYNARLCEKTFDILLKQGAFGSHEQWPQELWHQEIKWVFESPLTDAARKEDAVAFKEAAELLAIAGQIDPSLIQEYNARDAFRKAIRAVKGPLIPEEEADAAREQAAQMQQMQQMAGAVGQGAGVAEQVGKAAQALGQGGQALMQPAPEQAAAA